MRTKAEALAKPMAGDRWELPCGDRYEVIEFERGYVTDVCIRGIDVGAGGLSNSIDAWRGHMYSAEYLGGPT